MRLIDKEAGLEGLLLRPLSAQFLPETIPEKEGWVDREKLLNIQGRSRKPQIRLAEQYNIRDYPCPAGGCLLTDPGFARRIRDLMAHDPGFSLNDVHLLKIGRHFRLSPRLKLVVGRNEDDNQKIQTFSREEDLLFKVVHYPGPLSLLRGEADRYSKGKDQTQGEVTFRKPKGDSHHIVSVSPVSEARIKELIISD